MLIRRLACLVSLLLLANVHAAEPPGSADGKAVDQESLRHFSALVRLDTCDPPGGERMAVEYLKGVLDAEGIENKVFAIDPNRPNIVARLRGNGSKRPLLIMGHTDTVNVDPKKWKHGPFSADLEDGYIYGRGTVDDKDNVTACLMTMLLLKRNNVPLDRDVIFLAEAGEEGSTKFGIEFMVEKHFSEIDAEFCLAEGASVVRTGGKAQYGAVQTTEKIPNRIRLVANGVAGHGSVPLRSNAVVHLARAIVAIAEWQTPMRLNETTRAFFERLATISSAEDAARYRTLLKGDEDGKVQEYLAEHDPRYYSTLHTSISPNIIAGGYRVNVIPSETEATLDVRALPDEDIPRFLDQMRQLINDPAITVELASGHSRPGAPPSSLHTDAFEVIEAMIKQHYGVITLPIMSTGATDMAYLRARGIQCFGIGPMIDSEDGRKGFGAHSDQERVLAEAITTFVHFNYDVVVNLAGKQR